MDNGVWVKYNQESLKDIENKISNNITPEYVKLYNSVKGHNTLWCTETDINNAKRQVMNGDVYVYYTKDKEEFKIPRILLLTMNNSIDLIIGRASCQNIEPDLVYVLEDKIKGFSNEEKYQKKIDSIKKINDIYNKYQTSELSIEELRFLYEVDNRIRRFGYEQDERINELRKNRNPRKDYAKIFNCKESEVAFETNELNTNTICYVGDFIFRSNKLLPMYINGDLYLDNIFSLKGIKLPIECHKVYYKNEYYTLSEIIELQKLELIFNKPKRLINRR